MSERTPVNIEQFLKDMQTHVENEMSYPDAMQLTAVITGGEVALLVSQAINKYKEATYERTELFAQPNVDECALASMGKLWHGENFEGSTEHIDSSKEEIILDALYFILKYAKSEKPLEAALVANEKVCGDKEARKVLLAQAFNV